LAEEIRSRAVETDAALDAFVSAYAREAAAEAALFSLDGARPRASDRVLLRLIETGAVDSWALSVNVAALRKLTVEPAEQQRRAEAQRAADQERREAELRSQAPRELELLAIREREAQTARAGSPDPTRRAQIERERAGWLPYVDQKSSVRVGE
jgi:hypothetical protein